MAGFLDLNINRELSWNICFLFRFFCRQVIMLIVQSKSRSSIVISFEFMVCNAILFRYQDIFVLLFLLYLIGKAKNTTSIFPFLRALYSLLIYTSQYRIFELCIRKNNKLLTTFIFHIDSRDSLNTKASYNVHIIKYCSYPSKDERKKINN